MIKERTAFVFGAGLSANYRFPTNFELRDRIIEILTWDQHNPKLPRQIEVLRNNYFDVDKIIKFREQLDDGGFDTIDEFLEKREDRLYRNLGKMAIAMALIGYENPNAFKRKSSRNCFYRFLFKKMVNDATKEDFQNNAVSIITYNYDRSFEFFLWRALMGYYEGITKQEADNIMKKIKIIHVHGKLGDMHWQNSTFREYRSNFDDYDVILASRGIMNFNEVDSGNEGYSSAREEIKNSDNVVFVGFGFHPLNLSRLTEGDCLEGKKRILATRGSSISDEKVNEINRITKGKLHSGHMKKKSAVAFAHEHLNWL